MATEHEDTVRTLLTGAGLSSVYLGPVGDGPNIANEAAFVIPTGGGPPMPYFGSDTTSFKQAAIQVRVRSKPKDYAGGSTLARAVYDAIDHKVPSGYVATRPEQSAPIYLKTDDEDRHHWSINVMLEINE